MLKCIVNLFINDFMKKILFLVSVFLLNGMIAIGQTIATDFTANDCSGTSHHLFAELDAGKIIVISFVMPCGACVGPTISANTTVGSYATSNPGRVLFYLSDDVANTSCASLSSWASSNGMGTPLGIPVFSDLAFKESDYGTIAMPKIVVLAGADHKIIYMENGSLNATNMKNAIDTALLTPTRILQPKSEDHELKISPNPANNNICISYALSFTTFVTLDIYNITGVKVKTIIAEEQYPGQHNTNINLEGTLSNGMYFLKLNAGGSYETAKFNILN